MASKLQELIDRLCPDGVEYRKLGEIASVERGNGLQKSDFRPEGRPCIHYGQLYTKFNTVAESTLTFVDEATAAGLKSLNTGDLLMAVTSENVEDVCKCIAWLGADGVVVGGHTAIIRHTQDAKYLAYWFQTQDFFVQKKRLAHGTKVIEVTPKNLLDVLIPVPPLEIQREIVQILDNFAELTAELTAELEKRKKQYEYYRHKMMATQEGQFEFPVHCKILRGEYITKKEAVPGPVPVILGGQEPAYFIDRANHYGKAIVISRSGASAGYVSYWDEPIFATDGFIIETDGELEIRFLYHWLKDRQMELNQMKKGGGVPHITGANLSSLRPPLPPLAEQKRIVDILDRFDRLCNDLTAGLPAEIAARKKQYEYYRDKLLSFPPSPRGCGVAGNRKGMA